MDVLDLVDSLDTSGRLRRVARMPAAPRCWCCGDLLTTRATCPTCDTWGFVSPPHVCTRTGRAIPDERGCTAEIAPPHEFAALAADHETWLLEGLDAC